MTTTRLIVGPPGTGKTTELMRLLRAELEAGTDPGRIAFVTFTRAARLEVVSRLARDLGLSDDDVPWCRTVHSASYKLLGLNRTELMTDEEWAAFGKKHGYELSRMTDTDLTFEPPRRTADDELRWVLSWGRCRGLDLERTLLRSPLTVDGRHLALFDFRYDTYKADKELVDFTDMVERVLERELGPDVDVVFVDEAQDLSPLEISAVTMWARAASRVYVAGDPDQAVYNFRGADPSWMVGLSERAETIVLAQSHRVPARAHAIAQKLIRRNRTRIDVRYEPTELAGTVDVGPTLPDALDSIDGSAFVLSRNRSYLRSAAWHLFDRGRPYVIEGGRAGPNPYGSPETLRGVRTAIAVHSGKTRIDAPDVAALLAMVPSGPLVPHGAKVDVGRMRGQLDVVGVGTALGFAPLLAALRAHPTRALTRMPHVYREYFGGLHAKHGEIPAPKIRLMTIHASKGRETDHAVVLADHSAATDRAYRAGDWESENRIRYVAITRTKSRLSLCRPATERYYEYPRA